MKLVKETAMCPHSPNAVSLSQMLGDFAGVFSHIARAGLFCFVCVATVTAATQSQIGIYFDPEATENCAPNALYTPMTAYLIITHADSLGSVSGWEASVNADSGIYLNLVSLAGDGVTSQVAPDFTVGLRSALPAAPTLILAQFSLFAIQPGGLYLRAIARPSAPSCSVPVIVTAQNRGDWRPINLAFGSPESPVATIGLSNCSGLLQTLSLAPFTARAIIAAAPDRADGAVAPTAHATIPYGSGLGHFGWSSEERGPSRCGVQDFDILSSGRLVFLDIHNHCIEFLNPDLTWWASQAYGESLSLTRLAVRSDSVFLGTADGRSLLLSAQGELAECATDSAAMAFALDKGEPRLLFDAEKPNEHTTLVHVRCAASPEPPMQELTFVHDGSLVVIQPLTNTLIQNRLYIALYYLVSSSPFRLSGDIVVIDGAGAVTARVHLPENGMSCLRQSVKVGANGDVAHIAFRDDGVEVTTWHPAP